MDRPASGPALTREHQPVTRRLLPLLLVIPGLAAPPARSAAQPTVVLLVRHAEKAPGAGDVPLTEGGVVRARALAEVARDAGVSAVVTTQYQRTRETAAPLAAALGLTAEVVAAQSDVERHAAEVAAAVRRHAGVVVLVVGHSNTIPRIVAALGGSHGPDLCDAQYDVLFTVVIAEGRPTRTIRSRYGAPTPVGPGCAAMTPP